MTTHDHNMRRLPLNMLEQRMAFYANILEGQVLKLSAAEAAEWRRDLPRAVQAQYLLIDRGALPVPMTLANVRRLKTLDVENANFGVVLGDWECGQGSPRDGAHSSEP